MRIVVFDTETTGLPKNWKQPATTAKDNWPHIVSISWAVLEDMVVVDTYSYIIRPMNWTIPDESIAIHGITNEHANTYGHPLATAIDMFISTRYDVLLAHNLEFDENVLMQAIRWDLGRSTFVGFPHPKRCTMKASKELCKLPNNKYPKLSELYEFVVGTSPNSKQLHSSMYDVMILVEILKLSMPLREKLGLIKPDNLLYNVHSPTSNILRI
jgi:DNA polymerase III epsilon subunit-like protein